MGAFGLGAAGYPLLEICWRGRTHPAMALAGGIACWSLDRLRPLRLPRWQKALLGGSLITGVEAAIGFACNRRYQIWDYRRMPGNWRGQICVPYTLLWCALSWGTLAVLDAGSSSPHAKEFC